MTTTTNYHKTKRQSGDKFYSGSINNDKYLNLNLNHDRSSGVSCRSKDILNNGQAKEKYSEKYTSNTCSSSNISKWNGKSDRKSCPKLDFALLEASEKNNEENEEEITSTTSSTLSLHIASYETDVNDSIFNEESILKEKGTFDEVLKDIKQLFTESGPDTFEYPRQQNERGNEAEVMKFKASQKMHDAKQRQSCPGSAKKSAEPRATTPSKPVITTTPLNDPPKLTDFGHGSHVPANLLEDLVIELRYKEVAKKVGLIVAKSLVVINIYSAAFTGKIFIADYIIKLNDTVIKNKLQLYNLLEKVLKSHEKFSLTIKRPKWLTATTSVPKGYDLAPGYEYFSGLLILYPNAVLGINVKAYCSRVYVVRVEGDSCAINTCIVGDCIVEIGGEPTTSVTDCRDKLVRHLKEKRYVMLTIERAASANTIRAIRCVLNAEKTTPMDPRLATDTQKIGEQEAAKIKAKKVPAPPKGILKPPGDGPTGTSFYGTEKPHLEVRAHSEEFTIGCEPFNPLFFHKVKPRGQGSGSQKAEGATGISATGTTANSAGSGEKLPQSSSIKKVQNRVIRTPKEDESKKKKAQAATPNKSKGSAETQKKEVDVECSIKTRKGENSKRAVESGKGAKSIMNPTPTSTVISTAPSTPVSTPPSTPPAASSVSPTPKTAEAPDAGEKSKKGFRARVAAIKNVTFRKRKSGDNSQRQNKN